MIHVSQLLSLREKAARVAHGGDGPIIRTVERALSIATTPPRPVRLIDLEPRWKDGYLSFECPACCCERAHRVRVPLAGGWMISFYAITIDGVIDVGCWRGRIAAGEVVSE